MEELSIDQKVFVKNEPGIIRFIGKTEFASGTWIGVELQNAHGKNDGSVNDIRYFECEKKDANYGVFVRQSLINTSSIQKSKSIGSLNLESIINKLQDKLKNANEETKELKKKIESLKQDVTRKQEASITMESKLEMVTTDKEFLEDSNRKVNQALIELQLKYEDLKTDFQIMLEEMELNKQIEQEIISQMNESDGNDIDLQVILLRNRQLEIALTSLQKLSTENELRLRTEIQDLNQRLIEKEKEIGSHDELLRNLSAAQETIDSLQSQLDSALQLEKMIEHLNLENDSLNSKVSSLTKTIDELTELHELDKSLEESQALAEKELRKDIYYLTSKIKENEIVIEELNRKNKYMESMISEFKEKSNTKVGNNENLEELQMQLEALRLEFKKSQSLNEYYKITHDFINAKLEVLQENKHFPNKYKVTLDILLSIKINISAITIINNIITMAIEKDLTSNKGTLFGVINRFHSLKRFLENVSVLWEFNYNNEAYRIAGDKFYKMISDLQLRIDNSTTYIREGNFDSINADHIDNFLLEVTELMDLKFIENDETSVYFQNAFCSSFLLESYRNEASICIKIVTILKEFISTFHETDEFKSSIKQLDSINSECLTQEIEFGRFVNKLKDNFKDGNSINVLAPSMPHFNSLLRDLNSPIELLLKILKEVEVECRLNKNSSTDMLTLKTIFATEDVDTSSNISSVLESLRQRNNLMKLQIINNHRTLPKVYAMVDEDNASLNDNSAINDVEEELKSLRPKYAEISTKLFEKEKLIQELHLNIKFLQNSMEKSSHRNKEHIQNIKTELDQLRNKYEESNTKYQELLEANEKMGTEIKELRGSSQIENNKYFNNFNNLESENQYNVNMSLLDEISVLRKLLKHSTSETDGQNNQGLDWLKKLLVSKNKIERSADLALNFARISSDLRDISKNTKLVNISNNHPSWRPKASIPKYMAFKLEERATNYLEQRNLTLSLLSSLSS